MYLLESVSIVPLTVSIPMGSTIVFHFPGDIFTWTMQLPIQIRKFNEWIGFVIIRWGYVYIDDACSNSVKEVLYRDRELISCYKVKILFSWTMNLPIQAMEHK